MVEKYSSRSPEDTARIAGELAKTLEGGEVIAFSGGLGAGKTCFTAALARALGYGGNVSSPTFALVNEYRGGKLDIFHFDMYRVTGWEDLYSTGFFDYLNEGGVTAVEWSENIAAALPEGTIRVDIAVTGETEREITVSRE